MDLLRLIAKALMLTIFQHGLAVSMVSESMERRKGMHLAFLDADRVQQCAVLRDDGEFERDDVVRLGFSVDLDDGRIYSQPTSKKWSVS